MKILIAYGTTDGQTQKIARFCADHLTDKGHSVELLNVSDDGDIDITRFDAAILAGSIHLGKYQKSLEIFATANLPKLTQCNTLFLSVSLSAAGDDADDWTGLKQCVHAFSKTTGWTPDRVEHVAGGFRFTTYDFFRHWAMRWIAMSKKETVDPHSDKEYTDWGQLAAILDDWCGGLTS
jgi:menaquinone-dependent protoporphyrinogen oxidase